MWHIPNIIKYLTSRQLAGKSLGRDLPPIAFLGDTVADIQTIKEARKKNPEQIFISLAVVPPHLQANENLAARQDYENSLKVCGADKILNRTSDVLKLLSNWQEIWK